MMPERLLSGDIHNSLSAWQDKTVTMERISALLDRGSALALSMEKWMRSGLWVMTRSDSDYPKRLKQRLRGDSPAVLFGCGNRALLNSGGLAVVGSRNVSQEDLSYARRIGEMASEAGVSIVSGGARGVDESSMLGALEAEGTAVGIMADNLLRACSSSKYRRALMENYLALISPFNPEAGFNTGNAMARNKYIYCLADAALAVHSGKKGGTWSGAQEDLKKGWVPLWVKQTDDPEAGNKNLIAAGALEANASIDAVSIDGFFKPTEKPSSNEEDLFSAKSASDEVAAVVEPKTPEELPVTDAKASDKKELNLISDIDTDTLGSVTENDTRDSIDLSQVSFYDLFVDKLIGLCSDKPKTTDELVEELSINKTQLNAWLKQAVDDGHVPRARRDSFSRPPMGGRPSSP